MCWNAEASLFFAVCGGGAAAWAIKTKQPYQLYVPVGYFALMEVLQTFTYPILNQCGDPQNQLLTLLAYLHIAFQPFFFNMLGMYFIPDHVRQRISGWVYGLCFVATVAMIVRVFPFPWAMLCEPGSLMCGSQLCSVSGSWHMEWKVPTTKVLGDAPFYVLTVVLLPFLYGSWKAALFSLTFGIGLSYSLSGSWDELPAIWCLFSVGLILLMTFTPLREKLRVHSWFGWPAKQKLRK